MKSYGRYYPILLERLQRQAPFGSREEAANWLRDAWYTIHEETGASKRRLRLMRGAKICEEQGWVGVDEDVCYLESPDTPPIRLFLHRDGAIVLQQMAPPRNEIIFAKPGGAHPPAMSHQKADCAASD